MRWFPEQGGREGMFGARAKGIRSRALRAAMGDRSSFSPPMVKSFVSGVEAQVR
jgi:hypothetical protein